MGTPSQLVGRKQLCGTRSSESVVKDPTLLMLTGWAWVEFSLMCMMGGAFHRLSLTVMITSTLLVKAFVVFPAMSFTETTRVKVSCF